MHDPLTELAKIIVERKRGSDTEPLHDREASAIRKAESLVRILTEARPTLFPRRLLKKFVQQGRR